MSEAFGALHADFSARVAQFIENTQKAKAEVRGMGSQVRELQTSGEAGDRGLGKAMRAVTELGRAVGIEDTKLLKLAVDLREVATTAGTLGVAALAVGSVVAAFKSVGDAMDARWKNASEAISRSMDEQTKAGVPLQEQQRALADWQEARSRGITEEQVKTEKLVFAEKQRLDNAHQIEAALRRAGNHEDDVWGFVSANPTDEAMKIKQAMMVQAGARNLIELADKNLTESQQKQSALRGDAFMAESQMRAQAFKSQADQIRTQTATLTAQTKVEDDHALQGLSKTLADIEAARRAALATAQQQAMSAIDAEEARQVALAGKNEALVDELHGRFFTLREEARAGLKPVLDAIDAQHDAFAKNATAKAGRTAAEGNKAILYAEQDAARSILDLQRDSKERELEQLRVAYEREKVEAKKQGTDLTLLSEKYLKQKEALEAKYQTLSGQRQLAHDKERLVLDRETASFADGFQARAAAARAELQSVGETGAQVYTGLQEGFGDVFVSMKSGFKSAADVAIQALTRIADAGLRLASNQIFAALSNAVGFTPTPGAQPVYTSTLPGVGAPKSLMVAGSETKSALAVHVHNHVGAKVATSERQTPSGRELHVFVRAAVLDDLASHGPIDQALEARGVRRGGRSRG